MILDDILAKRKKQLLREEAAFGDTYAAALKALKTAAEKIGAPAKDFPAALKKPGSIAVIAEIKKSSPSKGIICEDFDPYKTAAFYEQNGAAAMSVLTEEHYFSGKNEYLANIQSGIPKLRKDFIFDAFQIYHARVLGADAALLIAAMLELDRMRELVKIARSLSLHILAEAHNEAETEKAMQSGAAVIGINNRDLKTFNVDLAVTKRLMPMIGDGFVKVSESGIKTRDDIEDLRVCGIDAVLVGETLMRNPDMLADLQRAV